MELEVIMQDKTDRYSLAELGTKYSGVITIGQKCSQVWNAIAIDSDAVDPFQCRLVGGDGTWRLENGQERTECPKGLLSSKRIPCNGCRGCCVNIRPGRPVYYLRTPQSPTLINGERIGEAGVEIKAGDRITFADVEINLDYS